MNLIKECDNINVMKNRKELFRLTISCSPEFQLLNPEQQFIYILACVEKNINFYFAVYLRQATQIIKEKDVDINT